jgi:hypothetical protein
MAGSQRLWISLKALETLSTLRVSRNAAGRMAREIAVENRIVAPAALGRASGGRSR